jgi:hypothetical protein
MALLATIAAELRIFVDEQPAAGQAAASILSMCILMSRMIMLGMKRTT